MTFTTGLLTSAALNAAFAQVQTAANAAQTTASAALPNTAAAFNAAFVAWVATLPTTLPATPGQPWNNGGVISVS